MESNKQIFPYIMAMIFIKRTIRDISGAGGVVGQDASVKMEKKSKRKTHLNSLYVFQDITNFKIK